MTVNEKIDHLEKMLLSGANSVTTDGVTVSLNIESLRQQLRELYRERDRKNPCRKIRMSGGYDGY